MTNVDEIEALYKKISERKAQGKPIDRLCVQLVKAFESSIQAIIKVNKINTVDESDLMVVAHVSIINAIDKFDPTKDAKFSTYADKCIKNAMHDEQRKVMKKIDNECSLEKMQEDDAAEVVILVCGNDVTGFINVLGDVAVVVE